MAGSGSSSAPRAITPAPARAQRRKLVEHPGRVAIVIITLAVVVALGAALLSGSDTDTRNERVGFPMAVEDVTPRPGELIRPLDTITADLHDGLTGVLLIDRQEVPLDQLEIVKPLSQISFRPGPDKDLQRFEPGVHTATVLYWVGTQNNRPAKPGSFSWQFRAGA
jgi:hypothetical protein